MAKSLTSSADQQRATGIIVALGLLALVFGFSLMLALQGSAARSNPVWFIAMLVVFGAALALIALVFRWLGLSAPLEAFGLPAGSIRTLLAVGVMVLFAVFGLQMVAPESSSQRVGEALTDAVFIGKPEARDAEIARYKDLGIIAVPQANTGDSWTLKLYRIEHYKPAETIDLQKQIVTALVTLVTSVVSFYFGSRSSEAPRDGSSPVRLPDSTTAEIDKADADLADAHKRLTALHGEQAAPGNEAALATAVAQADEALAAADERRTKLAAAIKDLGSGKGSAEDIQTQVTGLAQDLDALGTLLSQAEALVAKG